MITLLTLKKVLKKSWIWIKHNWYVPVVIAYTLVLWLLFRKKDAAYSVLEARNDSYKRQMKAIDDVHKEEIDKRNKILERYNEILKELEEKYKRDSLELDAKKTKEIKKLVEKYDERPDELAKLLAEKYGLEYVE